VVECGELGSGGAELCEGVNKWEKGVP